MFPKPHAGMVCNFSREVGDGVRSTPVIGDGYYDLFGEITLASFEYV